ncbi:ABC transporter substrate-binding protein [Motiliproteus sp. MSK22-1]|uniref:ABC transporter substrate-binding protein n=1 Tax=Motiliproteus sp. MSK22-1 TaxID=1897630 RepID=UPI0009784405|nr:ABC transporter substrate binding protein [Motiliproteus sp. MSK22-1]OMH32747.1 ABC transporter substrate-binding protein [Motiliproteus sp. MSK22-1]
MNITKVTNLVLSVLLIFGSLTVNAADKAQFSTEPTTNNGQRWRIGYYEGGEYIEYQKLFIETIRGMMGLGWIEKTEIPPQSGEQTREFWQWISNNLKSDYVEFVKDAHYTAEWNDDLRVKTAAEVMERLSNKQDLDLMVAMGTWAGEDLANDNHSVPTMVISASDPLSAGIIESVEDSGRDHIHATLDPNLHDRQLRVFHDLVGFKRLGVAYEDTVTGRSYAAMDVVEKLGGELNYQVVSCHTKSDISDTNVAEGSVINCFEKLAQSTDAIYVTSQGGVNMSSLPKLVKIANTHHIPTFSQTGPEEVKYGVLLSLSRAGYRYIGVFHAQTFAKVFNGAHPNQLDQLFEEPPKMAVNLSTAGVIGFNPPLLLLGAADEIYEEILLAE